jgi:hypothetical protein
MSLLVVSSGDTVILDPADKRVVCFDWDYQNLAATITILTNTFTITAVRQAGTALAKDSESTLSAANASIAVGRVVTLNDRVSQVRLDATTATVGDEYELANKVLTSETPQQQKEQSIRVLIQNR